MTQESTQPNWSASSVVESYTGFSREAFWGAYHWQTAIGLQRAGLTKKGGNILDIGCGPGWATFILKDRCPSATCFGVDLSVQMIDRAQELAQQQGYQDVHFVVGDALQLPFADNSFDLVLSSSSFHLWSDQVRGLQEAYRVLRPSGLIYIADIGGDVPPERRKVILDALPEPDRTFAKLAMEVSLPAAKVEDILRQTSFSDWECRVGGIGGFYPTDHEVIDWLGDGFPLRDLQKLLQDKEWTRELGRYWLHIYIRRPKE